MLLTVSTPYERPHTLSVISRRRDDAFTTGNSVVLLTVSTPYERPHTFYVISSGANDVSGIEKSHADT